MLAEYKGKPGALIPVLQIAQGIFGYLPEVAMKRIALGLGKSYSEVAGVVGFYSFFSTVPRGKHLVRVCLGTACYVRGGKQVLEACKQELGVDVGGTTPDGLFSLEVARCFGACGLAPTIMIDEDVHQRVKPPEAARDSGRISERQRRRRRRPRRPRPEEGGSREAGKECQPRKAGGEMSDRINSPQDLLKIREKARERGGAARGPAGRCR